MKSIKLIAIVALVIISSAVNGQMGFRSAYSEFFIEIPARGRFTVSLGDETISSQKGRFRFFDAREGRWPLVIESNNRVIYRSDVFIKPGMRTIAVLNRNSLNIVKDLDLERCSYDSWDRPLNDNYTQGRPNNGRPYQDNYLPVMSPASFDRFMRSVKDANFDKEKLSVIDLTAGYSYFTVDQIVAVVKAMDFSDGKISAVRKLYPSVADPENVFQLLDAFDYPSDKEKVKNIVMAGRPQRGR